MAALKAMAMLWTEGNMVAEQWLLQLLSLAPPSLLFFGAPNFTSCCRSDCNPSGSREHFSRVTSLQAAVKMQINPPNAVTPALLHFISQHNCLHRAEITGQMLFNCRAAATPSEPTNTSKDADAVWEEVLVLVLLI